MQRKKSYKTSEFAEKLERMNRENKNSRNSVFFCNMFLNASIASILFSLFLFKLVC